MEPRKCNRCLAEKPLADFYFVNPAKGILRGTCRLCDRVIAREYYHAHPEHAERVRQTSRARYAKERLEPKGPHEKKTLEEKRAARAAYMREYLATHPEARAASNVRAKKWLADHPENYATRRDYILQWHKDHPMPGDRKRKNDIKSMYGLTADDYKRMLDEQGEACALCGTKDGGGRKNPSWKWGIGTLSIDHCHKTGKVRGLLCHVCNTRLGAYEKLIDTVGEAKVKDYLTR